MVTSKSWLGRILAVEPVLTRGVLGTIVGVVAMILNIKLSSGTTEHVVDIVLGAITLITAALARFGVTPNAKVISYQTVKGEVVVNNDRIA